MLSGPQASELYPEHGLNQRILELLEHLGSDPVSTVTQAVDDGTATIISDRLQSRPPDDNTSLIDATPVSPQPAQQPDRHTDDKATVLPDNVQGTYLQGQQEVPSWLPDLESRISQFMQHPESGTDNVVNVTIGRVEVRAVHTDAPKLSRRRKKPGGVMSLDTYLERRERGRPL